MSLNNMCQKNKNFSKQQPSSPALGQKHSNTRFPPPPPQPSRQIQPSQTTPMTNSSPPLKRIPDERAVPFTQCPSPIDPTSSSRLRLSTIISSGTALEGTSPHSQSGSPMTTRSNPVQQQNSTARRPPLPPNKKNSASAAFAWATSTTPRMRVPLTNRQSGSGGSSTIEVRRPSIEEIANKFHYKGPQQVYSGSPTNACPSLAAEGSEPLKWFPFRNSTHLLQPPPPPPKIVEDIVGRQQDTQPQPSQQQSSNPSGTTPQQLSAEQHTFLKNLLQTARRLAPGTAQSWESNPGTPLLTKSPSEEPGLASSSSPSFPSNNTLNQLGQANLQQNPLQRTPSVGPFVNNGIPNEIQDDLQRIELLLGLGLEKYKEAINQKIQNHNQIIQLVKSRSSQLNAQQSQSQSQQKFLTKYPHPPYPYPHYPLQPQQQQAFPAIMDLQQSNMENMDGGEELNIPNVAKPVWSNHHTAEPFNTPDFTLNTFMEPHPEASSRVDPNHNDQSPISLLKPINFDDFQALAEQSRSGFQSNEGMQQQQQQNPLIAGALQYQSAPLPYHFNQLHPPCPDLNFLEPEVTKAVPLIIQVASRKETPPSPQRQPSQSQEQQIPELPRKQSSVQQQYQEYLQQDENNMKDLSPNSFKVLEQPVDLMPRKPVAVAKALPRSPSNLFPTEGLTIVKATDKPNTAKTPSPAVSPSPPPVSRGGAKKINLDKPSPFFPGFSEKPIQMKIKSPRTRTGGSSTGGQTNTSVTSGALTRKLEGVEELGNLLSQLPVLSRKQKVEEFQAFSTIKPETPLTEGDSETSMIPLVSSNGTMISDRRPDSGQRGRRRISATRNGSGGGSMNVEVSEGITTDEEFTNLDTNKMSINELVTLGRKIYRILSQLSTNSNGQTTPPMTTPQKEPQQEHRQPNQVYTAPVTLNVPTPNTPVFTPKAKSVKTRGAANKAQGLPVSPALIVDFNSMPNPTFITGPGVNSGKSNTKLGGSRTPSQQQLPPNLFRNIVKPPPTRWGDTGKGSSSSAKKKSKGRKISRRSTSSMMSATRAAARAPSGKLKKSRTPSFPNQQAEEVPIPKTMPTSFTVRENYNNNYTRKSSARYKRRQPTPYPYPNPGDNPNPNPSGMTINSNAGSGISRSLGRRNFIQENINKAAMMRKRQDSRVRPRKLPPVENYYRKMYDGVPSRLPGGSRSRSNSIHRLHHYPRRDKYKYTNHSDYLPPPPHDNMMRRVNEQSTRSRVGSRGGYDNRNQRSSSVPATSQTTYSNSPHPSHYQQQQRSLSTPRPSTGMSVNMASSSIRSESSIPQNNPNQNQNQTSNQASRPSSQGILKSSTNANGKPAKPKNGASKVKFEKLPSKSSITDENVTPAPPPEEVSQMARKSRSKTKRTNKDKDVVENKASTNLNNQNQNNNTPASSASSAETQQQETTPPPPPPPPQPKKKIVRMKPKANVKNKKQVSIPENVSTDLSDNNEQKVAVKQPVFNSESDQKIIRNVVKEEIKLMVNRKVKKSINKLKHRSTSKKSSGGRGEEDFIKRRIDLDHGGRNKEHESFQSGLRHRSVNSPVEREDNDSSGDITPVYTPPKFYDESLFSLEKWVNPDTIPPGSAYTSDNDTPVNSANNKDDNLNSVYGVVGGRVRHGKLASSSHPKPGVVRFSLPTVTNQMKIKTRKSK